MAGWMTAALAGILCLGTAGIGPAEKGAMVRHNFDLGEGLVLKDISGNGADGLVMNTDYASQCHKLSVQEPRSREIAEVAAAKSAPDLTRPAKCKVLSKAEIDRILRMRVTVSFEETPMNEVVHFMAALLNVCINCEPDLHFEQRLLTSEVRDVPAGSLFKQWARQYKFHIGITEGAIWFRKHAPLKTEYYDIAIIQDAMGKRGQHSEELLRLVMTQVDANEFRSLRASGAPGEPKTAEVRVVGGRLLVTASESAHRKIKTLLDQLREEYVGKIKLTVSFPSPIGKTIELVVFNGFEGKTEKAYGKPHIVGYRVVHGKQAVPVRGKTRNTIRFSAIPVILTDRKSVRVEVYLDCSWVVMMKPAEGMGIPATSGRGKSGRSKRSEVLVPEVISWAAHNTLDIPVGKSVEIKPASLSSGTLRGPATIKATIIPPTSRAKPMSPKPGQKRK